MVMRTSEMQLRTGSLKGGPLKAGSLKGGPLEAGSLKTG
jgi:hypothetical protein